MRCVSCDREAKYQHPLTGSALCGAHAAYQRQAAEMLANDAETIVRHLAASYVPEMREHDEAMLRRIVDQEIDDDERIEIRLHLTARKIAAHAVLESSHALAIA